MNLISKGESFFPDGLLSKPIVTYLCHFYDKNKITKRTQLTQAKPYCSQLFQVRLLYGSVVIGGFLVKSGELLSMTVVAL